MTNLAGDVVSASAGSPLDDEGPADAGAHRNHEDDLGPGAGTKPRLSGSVGIDVVLDVDRQLSQTRGGKPFPHTCGDARSGPTGDGVGGGQDRSALDVDAKGGISSAAEEGAADSR